MKVKNNMLYLAVGSLLALSCPTTLLAQQNQNDTTLVRTVVVEQEYNPDILDASKINMLPKVEEPVESKKNIEYAQSQLPVTQMGAYQALLPFTAKEVQPDARRGYIRLGYGTQGNVDAKLAYLFSLSKRDELGVSASLDGMNGKRSIENALDWSARYYSTNVRAAYKHLFNKAELKVNGHFGSDVFNYRKLYSWAELQGYTPRERNMQGELNASLVSLDATDAFWYNIKLDYECFKRHRDSDAINYYGTENTVRLDADMKGRITDNHGVGVALGLSTATYSFNRHRVGPKDRVTALLNPYYTYVNEQIDIHLGVKADATGDVGKKLVVAPDVALQLTFADRYKLYLNVEGGRQIVDYRFLTSQSPYWGRRMDPESWKSINIPIDAKVGLKASPATGLWFNLFAGYQKRDNDVCFLRGFSTHDLNYWSFFEFSDTKAGLAGAALQYDYRDMVKFSVEGTYYNWDGEILLMKPEFELTANLDVKLKEQLFINLGYTYVRRVDVGEGSEKPINNLKAGVTYKFLGNLAVFVRFNNLLNKDYNDYPFYPAQKFSVLAGASYSF